MKIIISSIIFSSLLCLSANGGIIPKVGGLTGKTTYGKDTKIGFEVFNKSSNPIWIGLKNGNEFSPDAIEVSPNLAANSDLDISQNTELFVWLKNPGKITITTSSVSPKPDNFYWFSKGKTLYLTWDKDNFPRPQTGPWKGALGKTESGLSLSKNLNKDDINNPWDAFPEAKKAYAKGNKKEAYRLLFGLPAKFSQDDLKSAYKKLALKWHPDKNLKKPEYSMRYLN